MKYIIIFTIVLVQFSVFEYFGIESYAVIYSVGGISYFIFDYILNIPKENIDKTAIITSYSLKYLWLHEEVLKAKGYTREGCTKTFFSFKEFRFLFRLKMVKNK